MENEKKNIQYSIVIPVYNSEKTLNELVNRITKTMSDITDKYEILLIDDGSIDNSWEKLRILKKTNQKIKIIHLLRNFGQHNAIICGLNYSKGDYVIMMDDDLQNPPEEIPKFIKKINEGYWVVFGEFEEKCHSLFENILSNIFQKFIHYELDIPNNISITNFVICKSEVIKNIITAKSAFPLISALITKSAPINKITNTIIIHDKRKNGKSNYNLKKYIKISFNLLIHHSSIPLKMIGFLGFIISIASICFGLSILINRLINPQYGITGWNSLIFATTFLGGVILFSIAITGEYLRRILVEVSNSQLYIIDEMEI